MFSPVPLQSSVIVPVEEVRLSTSSSHIWVDSYELQHGSGSALLYADYNGIWQLFIPEL